MATSPSYATQPPFKPSIKPLTPPVSITYDGTTYWVYIGELDASQAKYNLQHKNPKNRKISRFQVAELATKIPGLWKLNGETIVFSAEGDLLQGQHRHDAVIEADEKNPGVTIKTFVVEGVPATTFPSFDQLKPRSVADIIHIDDPSLDALDNVTPTLASAIRNLVRYETETDTKMSREELALRRTQYPGLTDSLEVAEAVYDEIGYPKAMTTAIDHLARKINPEMAASFWHKLTKGGAEEESAAFAFGQYWTKLKSSRRKPRAVDYFKAGLKAMGFHLAGKKVKKLHTPKGYPRLDKPEEE